MWKLKLYVMTRLCWTWRKERIDKNYH